MAKSKIEITLEKGKHYLVKHAGQDKHVRRFFKGTEKRFGSILCYVFSSKVSPKTTVRATSDGFEMISPYGTPTPSSEVSIPFYDIVNVKNV